MSNCLSQGNVCSRWCCRAGFGRLLWRRGICGVTRATYFFARADRHFGRSPTKDARVVFLAFCKPFAPLKGVFRRVGAANPSFFTNEACIFAHHVGASPRSSPSGVTTERAGGRRLLICGKAGVAMPLTCLAASASLCSYMALAALGKRSAGPVHLGRCGLVAGCFLRTFAETALLH